MTRAAAILVAGALALGACGDEDDAAPRSAAVPDGEAAQSRGWRTLSDATIARTEVAAARIGDAVYVVGGFAEPDGQTTGILERYDLRRDRWTRGAPLPEPVNHAAAAAYKGDLYVLGGYTARTGLERETNAFWRYDPETDRWQRLADAPSRRGAHVMGVIGNRLYAAGGAENGTPLARLEVYDFRRRRWGRGPAMRTPREHLAAAVHRGALYVLAGRAAGRGNFAVAERYVPRLRRWQRLPAMRKPRGGIAAATVGGRIVVVGGEEGAGTIREVEAYDPRRRRWRFLRALPTPRHGLGAVSYRGRVVVLEGGPTPGLSYSKRTEALRVSPAPRG